MKTDGKKPTLKKTHNQTKKDKQNNKRNQQKIPNHTDTQRTNTRWSQAQCTHDHAGFPAGLTWLPFLYIQQLLIQSQFSFFATTANFIYNIDIKI